MSEIEEKQKPVVIPAALHQELKVRAAKLGISLGALAAAKLQEWVDSDDASTQEQLPDRS